MQPGRGGDDALDLVRHARHHIRRPPPENSHIAEVNLGLTIGQLAPVDLVAPRALEQRVIDVRDVLHVFHPHAVGFQESHQHVEDRESEGVSHVPRLVGCDAADVDRQRSPRRRREDYLPPRQRVMDTKPERTARHDSPESALS